MAYREDKKEEIYDSRDELLLLLIGMLPQLILYGGQTSCLSLSSLDFRVLKSKLWD
jgi:hypothetical protein